MIAASADFPTLCSCDGDSRGRRQHPPHEPLWFGVGFVCLWVGGCLFIFFPFYTPSFFPGNGFVDPLIFDPDIA